jgi:hypothetical protein
MRPLRHEPKNRFRQPAPPAREEALLRLLETQEEQDRWLIEHREAINAKIRRGIDQLDRGEGIPEDRLDAYMAKLEDQPR